MKSSLNRARSSLDQRLSRLPSPESLAVPPKGWVRAIRDALGMSGAQLASRMDMTPQAVVSLEQSEAAETIQLQTLRRAASALQCRLVYALVPETSLEDMVRTRARHKALRALSRVSHTMAIEDQAVLNDDLEARIDRFVSETLRDRDLWEGA